MLKLHFILSEKTAIQDLQRRGDFSGFSIDQRRVMTQSYRDNSRFRVRIPVHELPSVIRVNQAAGYELIRAEEA